MAVDHDDHGALDGHDDLVECDGFEGREGHDEHDEHGGRCDLGDGQKSLGGRETTNASSPMWLLVLNLAVERSVSEFLL